MEILGFAQLITIKEMAEKLKVPKSWIYQRTRLGVKSIPHVKLGKYVRFDEDKVIDFFAQKQSELPDNGVQTRRAS